MRYLDKKFSVAAPGTDAYRDGWDRVFGKRCTVQSVFASCDSAAPCALHECTAEECSCPQNI